ncbi:MAG: hypothetical protein GKR90_25470 [Pseudomonadales bacterium]|nr:hypothetical protein [Pseudomonadales bacterium]
MRGLNELLPGVDGTAETLSPYTIERLRAKVTKRKVLCAAEINLVATLVKDAYANAPSPINTFLFADLLRSIAALCCLYEEVAPTILAISRVYCF